MNNSPVSLICTFLTLVLLFGVSPAQGEVEKNQLHVVAVSGHVTYSTSEQSALPLKADMHIARGSTITTGPASTADLVLQYNGTVIRMVENTKLEIVKLDKEQAGVDVITETSLNLVAGAIVGSQRKLAVPSRLDVKIPGGVATIVGTEYVVRADGAVTVLSGSVTVNYNLPGNKGSVKVTVPAGYSFDPATGQVVPTTPDYLVDIIADVDTVRQNAMSFKAGGATVVVKPADVMSPSAPSQLRSTGNSGQSHQETAMRP